MSAKSAGNLPRNRHVLRNAIHYGRACHFAAYRAAESLEIGSLLAIPKKPGVAVRSRLNVLRSPELSSLSATTKWSSTIGPQERLSKSISEPRADYVALRIRPPNYCRAPRSPRPLTQFRSQRIMFMRSHAMFGGQVTFAQPDGHLSIHFTDQQI